MLRLTLLQRISLCGIAGLGLLIAGCFFPFMVVHGSKTTGASLGAVFYDVTFNNPSLDVIQAFFILIFALSILSPLFTFIAGLLEKKNVGIIRVSLFFAIVGFLELLWLTFAFVSIIGPPRTLSFGLIFIIVGFIVTIISSFVLRDVEVEL